MNIKKPNLFSFATSELSQDAFFCWLLSWLEYKTVDQKNVRIQKAAFELITKMVSSSHLQFEKVIGKVKVHKQIQKIDIAVELLSYNLLLIVEDKIFGSDSIKKQQKYVDSITNYKFKESGKAYNNKQVVHCYLKTGFHDSSDKQVVENLKTRSITSVLLGKKELKDIFHEYYKSGNDIFDDFFRKLERNIQVNKQAKQSLFKEHNFNSLNKHLGQSIFFNELLSSSLSTIDGAEPFLKYGTSTGGQKWAELWITKQGNPNVWDLSDAIFYRIERRKNKPTITLRQYSPYTKSNEEEAKQKKSRYSILKNVLRNLEQKFTFLAQAEPKGTSSLYYSSVLFEFKFEDQQTKLNDFISTLKLFNDEIVNIYKHKIPENFRQ